MIKLDVAISRLSEVAKQLRRSFAHWRNVWTWNDLDAARARAQGWCLSKTDGGREPWQLRVLNKRRFRSDAEVWDYVNLGAEHGDILSLKAMNFLRANAPSEYVNIKRHARLTA